MKKLTHYKHTLRACYISYMSHAVVNNFISLLFVMFYTQYGISFQKLGLLATINFVVQLCMDLLIANIGDRVGYRPLVILSHLLMCVGLLMLPVLPGVFADPYIGLVLAILLYATGGGIIEVLISPIVEACPTDQKSGNMSLLHSFYCWGHVLMVLISTAFFALFGIGSWKTLSCLWALVPLCNVLYFSIVPIGRLTEEGQGHSIGTLFKNKLFWLFFFLMLAAGASEMGMSQWSSAFAETGLKVTKSVGDLLGPCLFAILMGSSRVIYAKLSKYIALKTYLLCSCLLCIITYLIAVFARIPVLALMGCACTGFAVGIMWPGTLSLSSAAIPMGGTAMFAFLALAGDVGCALAPGYIGILSGLFGDRLDMGILCAILFPIVMVLGVLILMRRKGIAHE
ncbi:MAG: MFS transporter [Clostridiales bacterium]|nr:MFS transporter [Clostridiales bacterium]